PSATMLCAVSTSTFTAPSPTPIYTLSLHDALPIFRGIATDRPQVGGVHLASRRNGSGELDTRSFYGFPLFRPLCGSGPDLLKIEDRKSTRLNSSHLGISYAVFCLKKKKE